MALYYMQRLTWMCRAFGIWKHLGTYYNIFDKYIRKLYIDYEGSLIHFLIFMKCF